MLQKTQPGPGVERKCISLLDVKSRSPEGEEEHESGVCFQRSRAWIFCQTLGVAEGGQFVSLRGSATRGQTVPRPDPGSFDLREMSLSLGFSREASAE